MITGFFWASLVVLIVSATSLAFILTQHWKIHDLELALAHEERKVSTLKRERAELRKGLVRSGTVG